MCVVEWWRSGVQSWRLCVETFQWHDDRDRTATRSQTAAVNTGWCTAGLGTMIRRVSYWLATYNQHWVMYCWTRYDDTSCVIITGRLQSILGHVLLDKVRRYVVCHTDWQPTINTGSCTARQGTTIRRVSYWLANYNQHWVMYSWMRYDDTSCVMLTGKLQSTVIATTPCHQLLLCTISAGLALK